MHHGEWSGIIDEVTRRFNPAGLTRGLTFHCAAVATNGVKFITGNTIGITPR